MAATPGSRIAQFILIGSALLLPSLSLIPLGGLYLWQNGYLLWWALASLLTVGLVTLLQRRVLGPAPARRLDAAQNAERPADPAWGPLEEKAWADVEVLAAEANLQDFTSAAAFADLARQTIETVARRIHPEKPDALWQFTLPEALAITERVSRRLAGYVASHVPFGDSLTLAQFLSIYRWRWSIELAERAYDVWRVLRFANPMTAVTHEARERLSRAALQWGRDHVARRLSGVYVEEVGRAAIDLYSGRLRVIHGGVQTAAGSAADLLPETPLTVLVAGGPIDERERVGDDLRAHIAADRIEGFDIAVSELDISRPLEIANEAAASDILLWVYDGTASEADATVLKAIADHFLAHRRLRSPVIIPVSIATGEIARPSLPSLATLPIDSEVVITPARLDRDEEVAALFKAIIAGGARGRRVQIARRLQGAGGGPRWTSVPRQLRNSAGAFVNGLLRRRMKRGA